MKKPRGQHHHCYYRWLHDLPICESKEALRVNWFEIEIRNAECRITYRSSFVTDLDITKHKVAELAQCARDRSKVENEAFNELKTKG